MQLNLKDKIALVTGGARGIGRAIAISLAASGATVIVNYKGNQAAADEVVQAIAANDGQALAIQADISQSTEVERLFKAVLERSGKLDILVNNAGITRDTLLLRMSEEQFGRVIDTNLTGAWRCAKRASGKMLRAKWGRMIFISSVVGLYGGAGQANYAASKAGLVGLARSITREFGGRNITANVVAPGFVATDMTAALGDKRHAEILAAIPAGRFANLDEVAAAVTWLAGDSAGYISGAVIPVDGGLGMGH